MNKLVVKVKKFSAVDDLSFIEFDFKDEPIYFLGFSRYKVKQNQTITLGIKPINIEVSKNFDINTSYLNQLKVSVLSIEEGNILTSIKGAINGVILEALITTKTYNRLNINIGDSIVMLLPENEIVLL